MSRERQRERVRKAKSQEGIPVVCLICLDLVRDKLRSDWANCQRAETPAAQSID